MPVKNFINSVYTGNGRPVASQIGRGWLYLDIANKDKVIEKIADKVLGDGAVGNTLQRFINPIAQMFSTDNGLLWVQWRPQSIDISRASNTNVKSAFAGEDYRVYTGSGNEIIKFTLTIDRSFSTAIPGLVRLWRASSTQMAGNNQFSKYASLPGRLYEGWYGCLPQLFLYELMSLPVNQTYLKTLTNRNNPHPPVITLYLGTDMVYTGQIINGKNINILQSNQYGNPTRATVDVEFMVARKLNMNVDESRLKIKLNSILGV